MRTVLLSILLGLATTAYGMEYEVIYANGSPVFPPKPLTTYLSSLSARVLIDNNKEIVVETTLAVLSLVKIQLEPIGFPSYQTGTIDGRVAAIAIRQALENESSSILLKPYNERYDHNSNWFLGFWNHALVSLGVNLIDCLNLSTDQYNKGYQDGIQVTKVLYTSRSHNEQDQLYQNGYYDGYDTALTSGFDYGYSVGAQEGYTKAYLQLKKEIIENPALLLGSDHGLSPGGGGRTYVRSYTRKDGTHVSGYYRKR